MDKLSKRLLNLFLISGIGFFVLVSLMFVLSQIWPSIWEEWNDYKKGANLKTAQLKSMRVIKNDFYSQSYFDSLENVSEHAWLDARKANPLLSPNGASDYELEMQDSYYSLQFTNLKDSIVYIKLPSRFNPRSTQSPGNIGVPADEVFPSDIIDDSLQLQICFKDSIINCFRSFTLRSSLDIGKGFNQEDAKDIKMISEDKKIVIYVNFELK